MQESELIHVLIVDDEEPARARLRRLLAAEPDFTVVGECANGREAVLMLSKASTGSIDVVFLDIQMPRMTGFEVCNEVGLENLPLVVFVTAYNQFALQAFEVHALDYLLKPFDRERFQRCLDRLRQQVRQGRLGSTSNDLKALLEEIKGGNRKPLERLAFKSDGKVILIRVNEVDWVEADGNYVHIHAGPLKHFLRETLTALESQLDPAKFIRISRSTLVNLDRIKELHSLFYGDFSVILEDGTKLTMSRNYRDKLEALLGRKN